MIKKDRRVYNTIYYEKLKSGILLILLPFMIGMMIFTLIYGFSPLNITNDRWILSGYD
ncbi:hypothetical protein [Roseburia sp. 1XD42-69]|uniref:hypothetical protein n=1 Tax=Roseburia sp. 1XD42-69 TaxID=2320088 RepID=UPI0013145E64|nr:hypothetical protein [Roseburia sp. 1XD42-69]